MILCSNYLKLVKCYAYKVIINLKNYFKIVELKKKLNIYRRLLIKKLSIFKLEIVIESFIKIISILVEKITRKLIIKFLLIINKLGAQVLNNDFILINLYMFM